MPLELQNVPVRQQIVPPVGAQDVLLELRGAGYAPGAVDVHMELQVSVPMELQVSVPLELVGLPLELNCVHPEATGSTGVKRCAPGTDGCA